MGQVVAGRPRVDEQRLADGVQVEIGTLPGDADLDGQVDFSDFILLAQYFEQPVGWAGGDFDGDGFAGFKDFLIIARNFGETAEVRRVQESSQMLAIVAFHDSDQRE